MHVRTHSQLFTFIPESVTCVSIPVNVPVSSYKPVSAELSTLAGSELSTLAGSELSTLAGSEVTLFAVDGTINPRKEAWGFTSTETIEVHCGQGSWGFGNFMPNTYSLYCHHPVSYTHLTLPTKLSV